MKKYIFVLIGVILLTTLFMPGITANAAQMNPQLILTSDTTVQRGSQFELTVKFEGTCESIYAQDLKIEYNADIFTFCSTDSLDSNIAILICNKDTAGSIRIISASMNGLNPESSLYKIKFNVKDVKYGTKEQFKLSDIKFGTAPEGTIIQSVGNSITVNFACDKTILVKKMDNAKLLFSKISKHDKKDVSRQITGKALQKAMDYAAKVYGDIGSDQILVDSAAKQLDKAMEDIG